jgi:hypothetical protein
VTSAAPAGITRVARAALLLGGAALVVPWIGLGLAYAGSDEAYGILLLAVAPFLAVAAFVTGLVGTFGRTVDRQSRAAATSGALLGAFGFVQVAAWFVVLISTLE